MNQKLKMLLAVGYSMRLLLQMAVDENMLPGVFVEHLFDQHFRMD